MRSTWVHALAAPVLLFSLAERGAAAQAREDLQAAPAGLPNPAADAPRERLVLEGFVLTPDGLPAEGALVLCSAGGQAVTDAAGGYRLEVDAPREAEFVELTAVRSAGGSLSASTRVALTPGTRARPLRPDPLHLMGGTSCSASWLPTFGGAPGVAGNVYALAVFDDGSGPALHAGGSFVTAGGVAANRVARWNGTSWASLGSGMSGPAGYPDYVRALAVYDDGSGSALFAAGQFVTAGGAPAGRIAKWDGASWSTLGSGLDDYAYALAVYDDGSGPALYVGGQFTTAGGVPASGIARWNGSSWAGVGGGMNDYVSCLLVRDPGSGPKLFAGGGFTMAGGVAANRIARWDGSSWVRLGSGVSGGGSPSVDTLVTFDDGSGPALYAGGDFFTAGGASANRVAKWNGSSWAPLGSGVNNGVNNRVAALAAYDDGGGAALYVGGIFQAAGGAPASRIAKWNGSSWAALGSGMDYQDVSSFLVHDDGSGPALFTAGSFTTANGVPANSIAKLDGSGWSTLGKGLNDTVRALVVHDDGSGPALYAAGTIRSAGGLPTQGIGRWNGTSWSTLGSGILGEGLYYGVRALAVYDDGAGPALYAGGNFTSAGGVAVNHVARWDGSSWAPLGSGVGGAVTVPTVQALVAHDDGSGPALYAGGFFLDAGGVAVSHIARWNGASWSAVGNGLSGAVQALAVFDDGSGPALYAGGEFQSSGTTLTKSVARWDGSTWSALGSGVTAGAFVSYVHALAVHDDGSGPALYVGGTFTSAGGVPATRVARWNGSNWSALGSGISGGFMGNIHVDALASYDDGSGPALYAGGLFENAGGVAVNQIARWNGTAWSTVGGGMAAGVLALVVHDDGGGPALYAGGEFSSAFDAGDSYLARWGCPPDTAPPVLSCPVSRHENDFGTPGEVVHFVVNATDDVDPSPDVVCVPPSGSVFPRGTTLVTCTATDAFGKQATCQFPVTVELPRKTKP